ncbi:MAG: hypothetical protein V1814_01275 [Candidatus Moraniibacteriota bacterium]
MTKLRLFLIMVVVIFLANHSSVGAAGEVLVIPALPSDLSGIRVIKPDPAVPKKIAELLGEWEGDWITRPSRFDLPQKVRRAKMIVYEVSATKIKYLWGVSFNPVTKAEARWSKYASDLKESGGKNIFYHEGSYGFGQVRTTEFYLENGVLQGAVGSASIEMRRVGRGAF